MAGRLPPAVPKVFVREGTAVLSTVPAPLTEAAAELAKQVPPPPKNLDAALVKAARRPGARVNLHPRAAIGRIGRDSATVAKRVLAGESARLQPKFQTLIAKLSVKDWTELLLKLRHGVNEVLPWRVVAVKGLLFELWVRHLKEFEALLTRCRGKLRLVTGWHEEVFVVRAARTLDDGREVADYLVVAFDRVDEPQRMWVLAVIESKSEHNAISIARHESASAVAALGQEASLFGQPQQSLRRIKSTGVDLSRASVEGKTAVTGLGRFKAEQITIKNESARTPEFQTTELIGVVPTDAPAGDLRRIDRDARKQGTQVWWHETTGMETNFVSYDVIRAFDE